MITLTNISHFESKHSTKRRAVSGSGISAHMTVQQTTRRRAGGGGGSRAYLTLQPSKRRHSNVAPTQLARAGWLTFSACEAERWLVVTEAVRRGNVAAVGATDYVSMVTSARVREESATQCRTYDSLLILPPLWTYTYTAGEPSLDNDEWSNPAAFVGISITELNAIVAELILWIVPRWPWDIHCQIVTDYCHLWPPGGWNWIKGDGESE